MRREDYLREVLFRLLHVHNMLCKLVETFVSLDKDLPSQTSLEQKVAQSLPPSPGRFGKFCPKPALQSSGSCETKISVGPQQKICAAYQCGSSRYAREASVSVNPTAPQENVSSKTRRRGSFLKLSRISCRSFCGMLPSKRKYGMPACSSPAATTFSVSRHVEKTTLFC